MTIERTAGKAVAKVGRETVQAGALGLGGLRLREAVARSLGFVPVTRPRECMPGNPFYFWRDQDGFSTGHVAFADESLACLDPFETDLRFLPTLADALSLRDVWFRLTSRGPIAVSVEYRCPDPRRPVCASYGETGALSVSHWEYVPTAVCQVLAHADAVFTGYADEAPRMTGRDRLPEAGDRFRIRHTPYFREVVRVLPYTGYRDGHDVAVLRTRRTTREDGPPVHWDRFSVEQLEYESRADGGPVTRDGETGNG